MQPALTLSQYAALISQAVNTPSNLKYQWVVAELLDLSDRTGHCYAELIEKHPQSGQIVARLRACIWRQTWQPLSRRFYEATGQRLATGMKVLLQVSASHSAQYGLSVTVHDVDPSFTLGAKEMMRREALARLQREGIINLNRELPMPVPVQRVAVISAQGAAGYGDFINQLYNNPRRLRFCTRLYPAVMQGQAAPRSILAALEAAYADAPSLGWQAVAIMRGGGGTSDLNAYEDFELAAAVAQYPMPVIVGVGHERDITLLDYVCNTRVKTPTAAAEWLISQAAAALERVQALAADILTRVRDRLSGDHRQLAYLAGTLPGAAIGALSDARARQLRLGSDICQAATGRVAAGQRRLDALESVLATAPALRIERASTRLDTLDSLIRALSPQATLARGYSITRGPDGRAVTRAADIAPGTVLTTLLRDGSLTSIVES